MPLYTPEPDVIHEVIGHTNQLGHRGFADLYEAMGRAVRRVETDEALERLSRVWWFTLEFGVVRERGDLKTYGAGILSSFGELDEYRHAEMRPFDLAAMAGQEYDITKFQPVLFAAESMDQVFDELTRYFDAARD